MTTKMLGNYELVKMLGEGAFAKVYLGEKNNKKFILKVVKKSKFKESELTIFKYVSEKCNYNECKYIEDFEYSDVYDDYRVIVSKYLENSLDLFDYIQYMNDRAFIEKYDVTESIIKCNTVFIVKSLIKQLNCFHENDIIHMDIKPENILLQIDENLNVTYVTLIDFGLSCTTKMTDIKCQKSGTINYMAPEILRILYNNNENYIYDYKKTDIWSLGVVFFLLVTNILPSELNKLVQYKEYNDNLYHFYKTMPFDFLNIKRFIQYTRVRNFTKYFDYMQNIIGKMLMFNPDKRYNCNILQYYV